MQMRCTEGHPRMRANFEQKKRFLVPAKPRFPLSQTMPSMFSSRRVLEGVSRRLRGLRLPRWTRCSGTSSSCRSCLGLPSAAPRSHAREPTTRPRSLFMCTLKSAFERSLGEMKGGKASRRALRESTRQEAEVRRPESRGVCVCVCVDLRRKNRFSPCVERRWTDGRARSAWWWGRA